MLLPIDYSKNLIVTNSGARTVIYKTYSVSKRYYCLTPIFNLCLKLSLGFLTIPVIINSHKYNKQYFTMAYTKSYSKGINNIYPGVLYYKVVIGILSIEIYTENIDKIKCISQKEFHKPKNVARYKRER